MDLYGPAQVVDGRHFLYRPAPRYSSLAHNDYQLPETGHYARRRYYDPLGNFLVQGYDAYEWLETRTSAWSQLGGGYLNQAEPYRAIGNALVCREGHKDWDLAVIIGDRIRTTYTPLTLQMPLMSGVRVDARQGAASLTLSAAPLGEGNVFWGGHAEVELGALQLGMTAWNHARQGGRQPGFGWRGHLGREEPYPSFLVVRVADDDPDDQGGGAYLQEVIVAVNGEERRDLHPFVVRIDARNPTALGRRNRITGQFARTPYEDGGTKYADVFALQRHLAGEQVQDVNLEELVRFVEVLPPGGAGTAEGDEVILAFFDLAGLEYVRDVEVRALVGNDYDLSLVSLYERDPRQSTDVGRWAAGTLEGARRAPDRVADLSNLGWVSVAAGAWTGTTTLGVNGSWAWGSLALRGEYARRLVFRQYPAGRPGYRSPSQMRVASSTDGRRSLLGAGAGYVTATWTADQIMAGVELFCTALGYTDGVPTFVLDDDDENGWPDSPTTGAFPGNDEDHDGFPDTNRNANGLPDYEEPFLLFDSEPSVYSPGRDWNHNGVVDRLEDDLREDFPYAGDLKGWHGFALWRVTDRTELVLGRKDAAGMSSGAPDRSSYGQASWGIGPPGRGVSGAHLVERVRDGIPDPYQLFEEKADTVGYQNPVFRGQVVADPLQWLNSWGQQHHVRVDVPLAPWLVVDGHATYRANRQLGGVANQGRDLGRDRIALLTAVARGQMEIVMGARTRLGVQGKVLRLLETRRSVAEPLSDQWTLVPIAKVECRLTPQTQLRAGVQGFPGLPMRVWDGADPRNSRRERVEVLQLTNTSDYLGYRVAVVLGLRARRVQVDAKRERDLGTRSTVPLRLERDMTSVFLRCVLGWDYW